jgi:hypothetical protein
MSLTDNVLLGVLRRQYKILKQYFRERSVVDTLEWMHSTLYQHLQLQFPQVFGSTWCFTSHVDVGHDSERGCLD